MSIPAGYRDELQEVAERPPFLTAEQDCLKLYPFDDWCDYEEKILGVADVDPDAQDYVRFVISNAVEAPIDKQGRVLVPQHLRQHAGLEKDVTFAGVGKTVEVWDTARLNVHEERTRADFRSISANLAGKLSS